MERLTRRDAKGEVIEPRNRMEAWRMAKRLAAYEDTEQEPEEVEKLKAEVDIDRLKEIWDHTTAKVEFDVTFARLRELLQAERDGRLVVLPCKVGDTVYHVVHMRTCAPRIVEYKINTLGEAVSLVGRMGKMPLVDTYLTRQEAEAAVERLKGEGAK